MENADDVIAALGHVALGTRLKRLAEHLQAGVAVALSAEEKIVQPGQLPLLIAIEKAGGLTVAQLVHAIGVSQPAVSRSLGGLRQSGLVRLTQEPGDARVRRVQLTAKSRKLLERLRESLFPRVADAAAELCSGLRLLDDLAVIERRNRELPFVDRIGSRK